jgi:acetyl-CoA carboxylase biotin carboxyl carrier protein
MEIRSIPYGGGCERVLEEKLVTARHTSNAEENHKAYGRLSVSSELGNDPGRNEQPADSVSSEGGTEELPFRSIDKLVELVQRQGVGEVKVRKGDLEISVKATSDLLGPPRGGAGVVSAQPLPEPSDAEPLGGLPKSEAADELSDERSTLHAVLCPVVGTFYTSSSPGKEPFVKVGDRVMVGQTLCIVEAMKLMNEIPADVAGEVVEMPVENGSPVQYSQPLVYIRPGS